MAARRSRRAVAVAVVAPLLLTIAALLHRGVPGIDFDGARPSLSPAIGQRIGLPSITASPRALVAADLDGDGRVDLAVAEQYRDGVTLWQGASPAAFVPTGAAPVAMRRLPMARAGQVELIVANGDGRSLTPLHPGVSADGRTTLIAGAPLPLPGRPLALAVGRRAGLDGTVEVAVLLQAPAAVQLWQVRDGSYRAVALLPLAAPAVDVALGDVDGDGRDDVVVAQYGRDRVIALCARGNAYQACADATTASGPVALVMADLDRNGRDELVVACRDAGEVIAYAAPTGGPLGVEPPRVLGRLAAAQAVAVGDLDTDGRPDLLAVGGRTALLLPSPPASGKAGDRPTSLPLEAPATAAAIADLDHDGRPDLLIGQLGAGDVARIALPPVLAARSPR